MRHLSLLTSNFSRQDSSGFQDGCSMPFCVARDTQLPHAPPGFKSAYPANPTASHLGHGAARCHQAIIQTLLMIQTQNHSPLSLKAFC
jgi:hypothetical protein